MTVAAGVTAGRPAAVRRVRLAALATSLAAIGGVGYGCAGRIAGLNADSRVVSVDTAFTSGGVRIAVERVAIPGAGGRHPAVLVLHPSDGVAGSGAQYVRRYAQTLASNGYVAYVVHYFDRTGDTRTDDPREDAEFPVWTATLEDAVSFAQHDPAVNPARIGVFGYSLGAWMGIALGAEDRRVGAVVGIGTGMFDALRPKVKRLPPTLLLHGRDDDVVPLAKALAVDSVLRRLGVVHALVVYPGEKHGFDERVDPEARERVVRFLNRELRRR
ncbi:MAG TPA: dienelactone hydrolase family protein [Gemmatirosa sp.]